MDYGAMLSLGHAAYYALGAYATGLLTMNLSWPMMPAMLAGPLVAAVFALIFGAFIVRTSHQEHAYFLMLTLAFSQLVFAMIFTSGTASHAAMMESPVSCRPTFWGRSQLLPVRADCRGGRVRRQYRQ
jgi:ABC-type branched-subunit amino acid transport system permease subunit